MWLECEPASANPPHQLWRRSNGIREVKIPAPGGLRIITEFTRSAVRSNTGSQFCCGVRGMGIFEDAVIVFAAFVLTLFISAGTRAVGNFSANLKALRAYKFDE